MPLKDVINRRLDAAVRPGVRVCRKRRSSFRVCGYTGLAAAILLSMALVLRHGLSLWVMAGLVLAAMATFLALAMITKLIVGEERLIYYHHEVAVMAVAGALLWLLGQPVLPYLGVTLLGVGAFLACGRVGCLMVGCCHGRPHRWGVRYRPEHADAGFPRYLVGVRLFPIQAVESLWVAGVVAVGCALLLRGEFGEALAWYVIAYDAGRFCFEFMRGDASRPYLWGFSEAQWFSVILMCLVVLAEAAGLLPFHAWHGWATAAMILAMVGVGLSRPKAKTAKHRLHHASHIRELAEVIERVVGDTGGGSVAPGRRPANIPVGSTSLGVRLSTGEIAAAGDRVRHYSVSAHGEPMSEPAARSVADLILRLRHPAGPNELVAGARGVFHLVVPRRQPSL